MKRVLLLFWVLLSLVSIKMEAQNIYLVSVGVSDYPGTEMDLWLSAEDARSVHRLFKKNSKAASVLITNSNATKVRIVTSIQRLFSKADADDIVVFFFSGHGYQGGFVVFDDYLSYQEIRDLFSSCNAKNKMIFAQACFSGEIREGQGNGYSNPDNNIMLFLSSRSNEYSWQQSDMRNSWFVASLVRALKGGADTNYDRIITAKELFVAVSSMVNELSNGVQHPVMWGNFSDDMPVMIWK